MKKFRDSLNQLPSWTVLAWSNQLLSLMNSDFDGLGAAIYPLVHRLAQDYPQALWFAFNFIQDKNKYPELKVLLQPPGLVIQILKEFERVSLPSIR